MATPTLTVLSSDNFNRANQYPLGGLWELDGSVTTGLEVISDACGSPTTGSPFPFYNSGGQLYVYTLGADEFCSATVTAAFLAALYYESGISLFCRYTFENEGILSDPSYSLVAANNSWSLRCDGSQIASGSWTLNAGDVITLACVGTTIYALQNSTVLASVTNTTIASGNSSNSTALYIFNEDSNHYSSGFVSLFATGSASVSSGGSGGGSTPGSSTAFLGSVRVVTQAPAGQTVKYIGTVTKVASAPAGLPNPYLGNVIAGTPSSNDSNPALGEIVEVASAPAGENDPFLGAMEGL